MYVAGTGRKSSRFSSWISGWNGPLYIMHAVHADPVVVVPETHGGGGTPLSALRSKLQRRQLVQELDFRSGSVFYTYCVSTTMKRILLNLSRCMQHANHAQQPACIRALMKQAFNADDARCTVIPQPLMSQLSQHAVQPLPFALRGISSSTATLNDSSPDYHIGLHNIRDNPGSKRQVRLSHRTFDMCTWIAQTGTRMHDMSNSKLRDLKSHDVRQSVDCTSHLWYLK